MLNLSNVKEYVRLQMNAFGQEPIRRSENLNFDGMDGVTNIHIEYDIPSQTDQLEIPHFTIRYDLVSKEHCNIIGNILELRDVKDISKTTLNKGTSYNIVIGTGENNTPDLKKEEN